MLHVFIVSDKTDSKHFTEIPNFLSHQKCKAENTRDSVFTGVIWFLPTMTHPDETWRSAAPLPPAVGVPPQLGLRYHRCQLSPASSPASPPVSFPKTASNRASSPSRLAFSLLGDEKRCAGRDVRWQRGLCLGSPSWAEGSTHGSRPIGQKDLGPGLLSERKADKNVSTGPH